jgi:hypothetical protein
MSNKECAINIKEECADVYYESFPELPDDLRKKVSCYMLAEIFKVMVVPAIDHARYVDRHGCSNRTQKTSIEEMMNKIQGDAV